MILYFERVTLPLLKTIGDLRSSQTELRHLLMKKDKEIDEYKCEGGEIVLRHLKTVAFNDEEHMVKHKTYEEIFGTDNIPISLIEKPISVKREPISMANTTVKDEKNSMSRMTQDSNIVPPQTYNIKEEPHISIECSPILIKCEQKRLIKTEKLSNETFDNNRRKRMKKLNL